MTTSRNDAVGGTPAIGNERSDVLRDAIDPNQHLEPRIRELEGLADRLEQIAKAAQRLIDIQSTNFRLVAQPWSEDRRQETSAANKAFDAAASADDLAPLLTETARSLRELQAQLREAQFRPLGDNHHNALLCPYCNPDGIDPAAERSRAEAAEAQVEGCRGALEPFAEAYSFWDEARGGVHDDNEIDDQGMLTMGDLRRARQALAALSKEA